MKKGLRLVEFVIHSYIHRNGPRPYEEGIKTRDDVIGYRPACERTQTL